MTEVLSQAEIDELLRAINADSSDEKDGSHPTSGTRKVKIYDFKRPNKIFKEQIRAVSILHETFARLCTTYFSSYLGAEAQVHVASVDQLTYEEFTRSLPVPTTLVVVNMNPLKGNAVLEIDPAVSFSLLEILFGGPGEQSKYNHELTDIETAIMKEIIIGLLDNLGESWSNVIELHPQLGKIDTNPQFAQIVPPTEMVVLVTFEARIGNSEGMINFCVPYVTIEPVIDKLAAQFWYGGGNQTVREEKVRVKQLEMLDIPVVLTAELFSRASTIEEISKWKKNETIVYPYEKKSNEKCVIKLDGYVIFTAIVENTGDMYRRKVKINELPKPYKERKMTNTLGVSNAAALDTDGGVAGILNDVRIELSVEIGRTRQFIKDVLAMKEGTIIELDTLAGGPVNIFANGKLIAKGEIVVIDENFGVRVAELLAAGRD